MIFNALNHETASQARYLEILSQQQKKCLTAFKVMASRGKTRKKGGVLGSLCQASFRFEIFEKLKFWKKINVLKSHILLTNPFPLQAFSHLQTRLMSPNAPSSHWSGLFLPPWEVM